MIKPQLFLIRDTELARSIGTALAEAVNKQIQDGKFADKCIKMEFGKVGSPVWLIYWLPLQTVSLAMFDHKYKGATLYKVTAEMKEPSKAEFKVT